MSNLSDFKKLMTDHQSTDDSVFATLSEDQLCLLEDTLSNDEISDDEELFEFFIESDIPVAAARHAIETKRDCFLRGDIFEKGHSPLRYGREVRVYDPVTRRFKAVV